MSTPTNLAPPDDQKEVQPGEFTLPDLKKWSNPKHAAKGDDGIPAGTVIGLDAEKWAHALIDLGEAANRVVVQRKRLEAKGYAKLEGNPIVVNFPLPEVWVMPRTEFNRRRAERAERLKERVASGQLAYSATARPRIDVTDPKTGVVSQVG